MQLLMINKLYLQSPIYQNYVENMKFEITIPAIVYVPNKIISALCFPSVEVNAKYPHMDLMIGPNTT